jgi:hypothetical protein
MEYKYPLSQEDQRVYPEGFDGNVFVWDIDKTYLATRFSSMRGLARIPIEFAIDKHSIPGMPEILRGLRRGAGPEFALSPLYFVSASPPFLRGVIKRKMLMDGVEHDGIIFKDWLGCLAKLRPGRLNEQLGFKICALLTGRLNRPKSNEFLFGDDVEKDAEAFYMYARLLSREIPRKEVDQVLKDADIKKDDRRCILQLLDKIGDVTGSVERAFIHLEHNTPVEFFDRFSPLITPVKGAGQLVLALFQLDLVDDRTVYQTIEAVELKNPKYKVEQIQKESQDRNLISSSNLKKLSL